MKPGFRRSPHFIADVQKYFGWYWDNAGEPVAWRFETAVERTLMALARQPGMGHRRHFRHPDLRGLQSFPLSRPFQQLLLFYRAEEQGIEAWRLMHGARDLRKRLLEPPQSD